MADETHEVLIIGGGAAGITLAASLRKRSPGTKIAIVEPRAEHYYQPAFTLVGAGQFSLAATKRPTKSLIPSGVQLIEGAAKTFTPENNRVTLENGRTLTYKYLVVAAGLSLDWEKVRGLSETLGKNGVTSNYSPTTAPYTWECVQKLKAGDKAVFTQAPLPFKCPGAPQKAAYMTADHLQRKGILKNVKMDYFVHAPVIFGVPYFAKELMKVIARYGVPAHFQHNLVAVDGEKKIATFEIVGGDKQGQSLEVPFDFLHVTPPQSPPVALRSSPLANPAGFIDVDQATLQHKTYKNIFSLGDIAATPNSKTAAAVRKQSPVVVKNLMALMAGKEAGEKYDGYASCPLTTAKGKCIMAEFIYGGKVTPTFPLNPAKERWVNWWIKKSALPFFYWNYMLKGREWFLKHNTAFKE